MYVNCVFFEKVCSGMLAINSYLCTVGDMPVSRSCVEFM